MPGGNVLGLVDCFSGYVILLPTYSRTYAEVVDALVDGVFLQYGFPVEIRTDAAKEVGTSLAAQLQKWGVRVSSTKGFHAQGNAMIERIWGVVKAMLRTSPTLVEWRRQLKMAAFAINTAIKEQYATSPFEVQFGLPALGPVHASSVQLSDVPGPGEKRPRWRNWRSWRLSSKPTCRSVERQAMPTGDSGRPLRTPRGIARRKWRSKLGAWSWLSEIP